jgi:transposase
VGYATARAAAGSRFSPPAVALYIVKLACERPAVRGVALSQWDCREIVRQLCEDEVVEQISVGTVRRVLKGHQLKPWRHHAWLSARVPRDAAFAEIISNLDELYRRPLNSHERVFCVDEKTSVQPRKRTAPTRPAQPRLPNRVEHEYVRGGALNLFAAFDTRSGRVIGWTSTRKRAVEFIAFLEHLDQETPAEVTAIHLVLDNVSAHGSRKVREWLTTHPRFLFHFLPVHCSWMNQVEQWFSILQRKCLRILDLADLHALDRHILAYIGRYNVTAHPFHWTTRSIKKVMAKCSLANSSADAA